MAGWLLSSEPSLPAAASAVVLRLSPETCAGAGRSPQEAPLRLRLDGGHRRSDFSSGPTQASSPLGGEPGADSWKEEKQEWA